jgi:hypothetical protein
LFAIQIDHKSEFERAGLQGWQGMLGSQSLERTGKYCDFVCHRSSCKNQASKRSNSQTTLGESLFVVARTTPIAIDSPCDEKAQVNSTENARVSVLNVASFFSADAAIVTRGKVNLQFGTQKEL